MSKNDQNSWDHMQDERIIQGMKITVEKEFHYRTKLLC